MANFVAVTLKVKKLEAKNYKVNEKEHGVEMGGDSLYNCYSNELNYGINTADLF